MRPVITTACISLFVGFAGAATYDVRVWLIRGARRLHLQAHGNVRLLQGHADSQIGRLHNLVRYRSYGGHPHVSIQARQMHFFPHAYDQWQLCLDGHRARRRQTDSFDNHLRAWRAFSTVGRGGQRLTQASRGRTQPEGTRIERETCAISKKPATTCQFLGRLHARSRSRRISARRLYLQA